MKNNHSKVHEVHDKIYIFPNNKNRKGSEYFCILEGSSELKNLPFFRLIWSHFYHCNALGALYGNTMNNTIDTRIVKFQEEFNDNVR